MWETRSLQSKEMSSDFLLNLVAGKLFPIDNIFLLREGQIPDKREALSLKKSFVSGLMDSLASQTGNVCVVIFDIIPAIAVLFAAFRNADVIANFYECLRILSNKRNTNPNVTTKRIHFYVQF